MSIVKLNNNGVKNATAFGSITGLGNLILIKTETVSSGVSSVSFVDSASSVVLDNTYKEYIFTFNNIHGSSSSDFQINFSSDSGSNYNVTKTTSAISAYHGENDSTPDVYYIESHDLAQSTSPKKIMGTIKNDNDGSGSGYLHLFEPSSTTFVKHFISSTQRTDDATSNNFYTAGYCNTTSAIDAVQFTMASGNIDAGTISLYGVV
jgi:hypothetical protein